MNPGNHDFFVGRQLERQRLHELIAPIQANQNVIIGISGEAGLGKSMLLRQFLNEVEQESAEKEIDLLSGQCLDIEAAPYLPFIGALRKYMQLESVSLPNSRGRIKDALMVIGRDIVGLAPVIGPWLNVGFSIMDQAKNFSTPVEVQQGKLFFAIAQILRAVSRKKKIILAIEDVHWADRASLSLFRYLTQELQGRPIAFLLTFRSGPEVGNSYMMQVWRRLLQQGSAQEIVVNEFNKKDFNRYLEKMFPGADISADVRNALFGQTNGNPFFLSQIIPALLREQLLVRHDGIWQQRDFHHQLRIPPSVEATIQEALKRLPSASQKTLEIASVIGERFQFPVLSSASKQSEDDLDTQVDQLIDLNLITELPEDMDVLEFIHAITRDFIYQQINSRRRRRLHLKIAQTIAEIYGEHEADVVEILAHHFAKGGDKKRAIDAYLLAAEKAISLVAYDEALQYCEHALAYLTNQDPRYLETLELAGRLADFTSQWPLALSYYQKILELSLENDDWGGQKRAYKGIALTHFREGRWSDAEAAAQKHLDLAQKAKDEAEKGAALFQLGLVYWRTGKWEQAQIAYRHALQIQKDNQLFESLAATIGYLGVIFRNIGEYDKALRLYQVGIDLFDRDPALERYWLGVIFNNQGTALRSIAAAEDSAGGEESPYWAQSVAAYEKSIEIMNKISSWRNLGNTCNNLAMIYRTRKNPDLQKALAYCEQAEDYLTRINSPIDLIDTRRHQGALRTQLEQFGPAHHYFAEGLKIAEELGAADRGALLLWEIGALYERQQDFAQARDFYLRARQRFATLGAAHRVAELDNVLEQLSNPSPSLKKNAQE